MSSPTRLMHAIWPKSARPRGQADPVLSAQEIVEPVCDRGSERRLVERNTEAKEGERCLKRYSVTDLDRDQGDRRRDAVGQQMPEDDPEGR